LTSRTLLYRIQLVRERGLLLGWSVGLLLFFFVIGISYATVKDHEAGLAQLWEELPQSFRDAFGDVQDITTPGGYYKARATSLLPLVLGGALVAQATRRLSGAEQARELDLVLSLPMRRGTYLWSHWAVGATHGLAWTTAATIGGLSGMALAGVDPAVLPRLAFMMVEILPFVLAVHAGAILAGAALHRRPPGVAILASALGAAFLLQIVAGLDPSLDWLGWFSPYALWSSGDAYEYRSNPWYLLVCACIIAVCLPLAGRVWGRKDLTG
jgi:putative exporter of polyketide antibiotics